MSAPPFTCPDCGERISANLCQVRPDTSEEARAAIAELLVAVHRRLAGCRGA